MFYPLITRMTRIQSDSTSGTGREAACARLRRAAGRHPFNMSGGMRHPRVTQSAKSA